MNIKQEFHEQQGRPVAVIGLGYVGLPLAVILAEKKYSVTGLDIDPTKIAVLRDGKMPFADERIEGKLKDVHINFTQAYEDIKDSEVIVICVPTPVYANHMPNLEPVIQVARGIATYLKKGQLIILESTVNPGVSEEIIQPILETSGLKAGIDFYLAHCPERINPGDPKWHVGNIPRVVGSLEKVGLEKTLAFYRSFLEGDVYPMNSLREAEAVKVVENSFRDINIAFVNELAMSFSKLGIDAVSVIKGAATKPFAFLPHFPSCGVGGHCIPVDPYYLIEYAKKNGFNHDFLALARKINNHMPEFTVDQLGKALNDNQLPLKGTTVTVLGVAYKGNIDDCRESPSFSIIKHLQDRGANVRVYDPFVPKWSTVKSLTEALEGTAAVIIATAHDQFKKLSPEKFLKTKIKAIIDGCNCLSKEIFSKSGLTYIGIGR